MRSSSRQAAVLIDMQDMWSYPEARTLHWFRVNVWIIRYLSAVTAFIHSHRYQVIGDSQLGLCCVFIVWAMIIGQRYLSNTMMESVVVISIVSVVVLISEGIINNISNIISMSCHWQHQQHRQIEQIKQSVATQNRVRACISGTISTVRAYQWCAIIAVVVVRQWQNHSPSSGVCVIICSHQSLVIRVNQLYEQQHGISVRVYIAMALSLQSEQWLCVIILVVVVRQQL